MFYYTMKLVTAHAMAQEFVQPQIDTALFRKTLGSFPTGVVAATTLGDDNKPVGLTINSFSSVSLDPPLILWSIALNAPSLSAFRKRSSFIINILSEDQKALCKQLATPSDNKFKDVAWRPGYDNAPIIDNALAVIECSVYRRYEGGDHEIILGEVVNLELSDRNPLVYHRGQFTELNQTNQPQ